MKANASFLFVLLTFVLVLGIQHASGCTDKSDLGGGTWETSAADESCTGGAFGPLVNVQPPQRTVLPPNHPPLMTYSGLFSFDGQLRGYNSLRPLPAVILIGSLILLMMLRRSWSSGANSSISPVVEVRL